MLFKFLRNISPFRAMPVDDRESQSIEPITGETVQLYYDNSGTLTSDGGEAAGTAVVGQLKYGGIKSELGSRTASHNDTSLSYTCDALTSEVAFDWDKAAQCEGVQSMSTKLSIMTADLSNGEFMVDALDGTIWAKKATTTASMTSVSYKIAQGASGGSSSLAATVDVAKMGGETLPGKPIFDEDTAHTTGDAGMHVLSVRDDDPVAKAGADGDYQSLTTDDTGALWSRPRGYDTGSDSQKVFPIVGAKLPPVRETHVLTNISAASYVYIDMEGYENCSVHVEKTGGTDTFDTDYESSNEGIESTADWLDTTAVWTFQSGSASADHIATPPATLKAKAHRVEITPSGGTNDSDYNVFVYKW